MGEKEAADLGRRLRRSVRWGRINATLAKYLSVGLSVVGVFCSALAAVELAFMRGQPTIWLALLAAVPALSTALQDRLRLNERDEWHTWFADECESLLERLEIGHEDEKKLLRDLHVLRTQTRRQWQNRAPSKDVQDTLTESLDVDRAVLVSTDDSR